MALPKPDTDPDLANPPDPVVSDLDLDLRDNLDRRGDEPVPFASPDVPSPPPAGRAPQPPSQRAGVWPISLAFIVGLALGFALGMGSGGLDNGGSVAGPGAAASASSSEMTDAVPPARNLEPAGTASEQTPDAQPPPAPGPPPPPADAPGATATTLALPEASPAAPRTEAPPVEQPNRAVAAPDGRVPPTSRPADASPSRGESREPATVAGRILVRSTPSGARVLLDGRDVGETPVTLREVRRGSHTIRVIRDGYVAVERRVAVTAARPSQSLSIELNRTTRPNTARTTVPPGRFSATLFVDSRPVGAAVFLDGRRIGTTPLQISEVAAGEHAIGLELPGYRRWTSSVRVVAGERNRVAASLEQ